MTSAANSKADASTVGFMSFSPLSARRHPAACDQLTAWRALESASSVWPGRPPVAVNVTVRAFMRFSPLRAMKPSTLTDSPIFSVSRRQPLRCKPCGGPISAPQFVTSPVASSFTLM